MSPFLYPSSDCQEKWSETKHRLSKEEKEKQIGFSRAGRSGEIIFHNSPNRQHFERKAAKITSPTPTSASAFALLVSFGLRFLETKCNWFLFIHNGTTFLSFSPSHYSLCLAGIVLQLQAELNTPMNWNYRLYFYALHKTLEFYGFN